MMTLKAIFLFAILTLSLLHVKSQAVQVIVAEDVDFEIANELPLECFNYDKKTSLMYAFARDTARFFIFIRVSDERLQSQILNSGFNVWIDTTGKKKTQFGLKYPCVNQHRLANEEEPLRKAMRETQHINPNEISNELLVYGFRGPKSADYLFFPNEYGFSANASLSVAGILFLKYTIPIKQLGSGQKLSVGMEMGLFEPDRLSSGKTPLNAQMNAGSMDVSMGGGRHARGGGGMQQGFSTNAQMTEIKLWVKSIIID